MNFDVDWRIHRAAVWRGLRQKLKPITQPDCKNIDHLVGMHTQKTKLLANTKAFIDGVGAMHCLLRGARGCGKSSLARSMLPVFAKDGLRMIQLDVQGLEVLDELADALRQLPYKFIFLCDDIYFREQEPYLVHLKTFLEGSLDCVPDNVRVYATTNHRHLLPERSNQHAVVKEKGELHFSDSIESTLSLADRFGLWISFYTVDATEYLVHVDHALEKYHAKAQVPSLSLSNYKKYALQFARERGVYSARTAQHFAQHFVQGAYSQRNSE